MTPGAAATRRVDANFDTVVFRYLPIEAQRTKAFLEPAEHEVHQLYRLQRLRQWQLDNEKLHTIHRPDALLQVVHRLLHERGLAHAAVPGDQEGAAVVLKDLIDEELEILIASDDGRAADLLDRPVRGADRAETAV